MIENRNKLSVWLRISRSKYLYLLFILPFFYFVVVKYGAMMWLLIAFKKFKATRGLWGSTWVGLKYFEQFIKDPYFWKLVRNTVVLNLLGLVFSFPAPIVLALMINEVRSRRFKKVVQTVSYMPYFISTVAVCGLITTLLSSDGMITNVIRLLTGISPSLLTDAHASNLLPRDLLHQTACPSRSPNASILEPFCRPECISFRARMHQIWCAKFQGEARCLRMDCVSR